MKTQKTYSSKEEHERKNPYVLVEFFTDEDNRTIATIFKSFTSKKVAENYCEKSGIRGGYEIMTRKQYENLI